MRFFPEEPEHITADYFITVGPHCRAPGELRENNLKRTRFPLDWQIFSSDALIHCMNTDFDDYFMEVDEDLYNGEGRQEFYYARDLKNDILSMHDIPVLVPLTDAALPFHNITKRRWDNFCALMTGSKTVILFSAFPKPEDAEQILHAFQKRFSNITFHMVNVSHRENCTVDEIYCTHPCENFDQYYMCDEFVPHEWKGNLCGWKAILSHYSLNEAEAADH